jgi:hypothetical protein
VYIRLESKTTNSHAVPFAACQKKETSMPKIALTVFCLTLFAIGVAAQKPTIQPGSATELKGVTRIHVAANSNSARFSIVDEITRSLPGVTIIENAEDAEVWLVFKTDRRSFSKSTPGSGLGAVRTEVAPVEEYETVATGEVIKPVAKDKVRRLIEYKDASTAVVAERFSKAFAAAFIKSYKKANQD